MKLREITKIVIIKSENKTYADIVQLKVYIVMAYIIMADVIQSDVYKVMAYIVMADIVQSKVYIYI